MYEMYQEVPSSGIPKVVLVDDIITKAEQHKDIYLLAAALFTRAYIMLVEGYACNSCYSYTSDDMLLPEGTQPDSLCICTANGVTYVHATASSHQYFACHILLIGTASSTSQLVLSVQTVCLVLLGMIPSPCKAHSQHHVVSRSPGSCRAIAHQSVHV